MVFELIEITGALALIGLIGTTLIGLDIFKFHVFKLNPKYHYIGAGLTVAFALGHATLITLKKTNLL